MRQQLDITAHITEARYISTAWPADSYAFNYDPECFNRYIDMQANAAKADGFPGVAGDMRKCVVITGEMDAKQRHADETDARLRADRR
jgi:hypothetical protein